MKLNDIVTLTEAAVKFKGRELNMSSLQVDDVDLKDYPDFSDAYISAAAYEDGKDLTDDELDELMDSNLGRELANELAHESYR